MISRLKPVVAAIIISGLIIPVFAQAAETQAKAGHHAKHRHQKVHSNRATTSDDSAYNEDHPKHLSKQELMRLMRQERDYLPFDLDVPGQAFVSTGPYVGVPISYSGSNLIVNSPSVNTDVQLLGIRKSIHEQLMAMGGEIYKEPYHSHLLLSGTLSGQASYFNHSGATNGGYPTTNIDVSNFAFDTIVFGPSDWTLAFAEFSYDSASPANSVYTSSSASTPLSSYDSYTVSNSRLFINKAFATIGDFSKSPFYATFGQFYVPYGVYSSVFLSSPFTQTLGRTKARSIEVGFQQQRYAGFFGSAFIFRGDSHASSTSRVNNGGLNVGYKYGKEYIRTTFGASVIGNIADSAGMQLGTGFGDTSSSEVLSHRVPGYNLRGNFGMGEHFDMVAEFIGTTTAFSAVNMGYNGRGAKPWALDAEAVYSFYILDNRPSSVGIGYQHSHELLAMGIPLSRYSAVFRTSLFRNTLQGIEFRHDREYAASATANGPAGSSPLTSTQTGKNDNAVTAEFDYYF